jgi:TonB family protein
MPRLLFIAFILCALAAPAELSAQAAEPLLPKDDRAVFAAAAPLYDLSAPSLKPWRLKASYQLYNEAGAPTEKGTYEYWWASPAVYRSSWTRSGVTHTDWHTADGKHAYLASGGPLEYFEFNLQSSLLTPLPDEANLDPTKFRLQRESIKVGDVKLPCIMVVPLMPQHGQLQQVPLGLFPSYCFDPRQPVLRLEYSWGSVSTEFSHIVKMQGRYFSRQVDLYEGTRKLLTATVDEIAGMSSVDPALVPPPNALGIKQESAQVSQAVSQGFLIKKQVPIYPQDAKDARVEGKVVLHATIGLDGGVHDLHVVEAPWPSLVASALWAVSHWQYKPYLLNGEPVNVETTVNVIYSLGQ